MNLRKLPSALLLALCGGCALPGAAQDTPAPALDPAEFKNQMQSIFEKMGMPRPGQGGFGAGGRQPQDSSNLSMMSQLPVGTFVDAAV